MDDKLLFERLGKIELREGKERKIKSYVLRNNLIDDKDREVVRRYFATNGVFFEDQIFDKEKVFGNDKPLIVEIGFGMGDMTAKMALFKPENNYLGIEVYLKGFIKLLGVAGENKIDNLKVIRFDAVDVLEHMFSDGSVDGFHVFFPDPWPKKKHHKRRLVNVEFLKLLSRKLKNGGYFYMVTDWEEYAEEVLSLVDQVEGLNNPFFGFSPPVAWRPQTKFERKGLDKNYIINEIWLERV